MQAFKVSVNRFALFGKKEKETALLEADVDNVSVIGDGKGSLKQWMLQKGIYWGSIRREHCGVNVQEGIPEPMEQFHAK